MLKFNPITGNLDLVNPEVDVSDFLTETEADALYIPLTDYADFVNTTGDTMTGALALTIAGFQVDLLTFTTTGDSSPRLTINNYGILEWFSTTGTNYGNLYGYLTNTIKTDGAINVGGGLVSFEANGTTVVFAGNQYFNAGARRFNFSLFTGSDNFFLDGDLTAGGSETIFETNTDDHIWKFYRSDDDGQVMIGGGFGGAAARLDVRNEGTAVAQPVLRMSQADVSEEMMEFSSTAGTGNAIEAVGSKTLTVTDFIKVTVNGATRYLQVGTIA